MRPYRAVLLEVANANADRPSAMPSSIPQQPTAGQSLAFAPGWTVEIDPAARRLKILKDSLVPWRGKAIVNYCTFDECSAVGTVLYDSRNIDDPVLSFGVYLDFRDGREVIPVGPLSDASRLAEELSVATGIPWRDAKSWHRPLWGHVD